MAYLLDLILCSGVVIGELIAIIIGSMLIQLVVYQLTGFSIVNSLWKSLIRLEKNLENKI